MKTGETEQATRYAWLAAVTASTTIDLGHKSVATALWLHMNANFQAWPSVERLVAESGTSRRTVQMALRKLEMLGFLGTRKKVKSKQFTRADRLPNQYTLRLNGAQPSAPRKGGNGAQPSAPRKAERGAVQRTHGAQPVAPKHPIEHKDKSLAAQDPAGGRKPATKKSQNASSQQEHFGGIRDLWNLQAETKRQQRRIGDEAREFAEMGVTPKQVADFKARHERLWPDMTCTARSVAKNWELLAEDKKPKTAAGRIHDSEDFTVPTIGEEVHYGETRLAQIA